MDNQEEHSVKKELSHAEKVWQTTAIICLFIAILLILRFAFNILLMAFAGVLIAVYFQGLADLLEKKLKLRRKSSAISSIAGSILLLVLLNWVIGTTIRRQAVELRDTLPKTVN